MPTLARSQDGHYFIRRYIDGVGTWQVTATGVAHLKRRGVEEGRRFQEDHFWDLWRRGWLSFCGRSVGPRRAKGMVGDPDTPEDLRTAIRTFHVALRNDDLSTAWRFENDAGLVADVIGALEPNREAGAARVQSTEESGFNQFTQRMRSPNRSAIKSWQLLDVRTELSGIAYIATIGVTVGSTEPALAGRTHECDEIWFKIRSPEWHVNWDALARVLNAG